MDKAQQEHLKKNKEVYEFVTSDGWKYVKSEIVKNIEDLQSIMNIDGDTPEAVVLDIKVRKNVMAILLEWLRDVEGMTAQYESNEFSSDETEMMYIIRSEN